MLCVYQFKVVLRGVYPMIGGDCFCEATTALPTSITRFRLPWGGLISTCIGFTSTEKTTALRTRAASPSPMTPNVFSWANSVSSS